MDESCGPSASTIKPLSMIYYPPFPYIIKSLQRKRLYSLANAKSNKVELRGKLFRKNTNQEVIAKSRNRGLSSSQCHTLRNKLQSYRAFSNASSSINVSRINLQKQNQSEYGKIMHNFWGIRRNSEKELRNSKALPALRLATRAEANSRKFLEDKAEGPYNFVLKKPMYGSVAIGTNGTEERKFVKVSLRLPLAKGERQRQKSYRDDKRNKLCLWSID